MRPSQSVLPLTHTEVIVRLMSWGHLYAKWATQSISQASKTPAPSMEVGTDFSTGSVQSGELSKQR